MEKQNGFSIGAKLSIGMVTDKFVANITMGFLNGNELERYLGIQCFPFFVDIFKRPILIGCGVSFVKKDDCFGFKSSLFAGCFLFGNIDYNFLMTKMRMVSNM